MKFTNVQKWLAMLLVVCSMLSLVACGKSDKDSAGDDSEKGTKVAVVFASSGLGDKSFNDALYDGMKKAESTMGIQWVYSEPKDDAEYEGLISGYADSGDCDLIICLGGSQSSSLENVAPNYPQQKFVILDAVVEGDNIRSYTWRDQELGFLAGFLGASLSDTNTLGFIGAHDIPLCNLGAAGMIAGAHYANPDCQVLVDYANGWAEVNGCYELATSMHEQGASLIYHTASAGGLGILNAGKEKNFLTVFSGPPGSGKTSICLHLRTSLDSTSYRRRSAVSRPNRSRFGRHRNLPTAICRSPWSAAGPPNATSWDIGIRSPRLLRALMTAGAMLSRLSMLKLGSERPNSLR